jgi:hypothetical protein
VKEVKEAKELAIRLVDRFSPHTVIYTRDDNGYTLGVETRLQNAKNCALICVDEIQDTFKSGENEILYWEEVKQEINKL